MTKPSELYLARLTTTELGEFIAQAATPIILWPVGSTEPHGPHLPLATDIILSEENARRAAGRLREQGIDALIAPGLPYGVTDFAAGFSGAMTVPHDAYVSTLVSVCARFYHDGFRHVCLINHHLEPGQLDALAAVRTELASTFGDGAISVPQVVSRRWGRHLGDEFRSGACHAGAYEGSLVRAVEPTLFRHRVAETLPPVEISLSKAIKAGCHSFLEAGADQAYPGHPSKATASEGERLYGILTEMVVCEVTEHLEKQS
ncbi:MAG: creatininase family protein [Myxococcota bacterium]|nr:creatininase family protein [Myxococcota bacterium]